MKHIGIIGGKGFVGRNVSLSLGTTNNVESYIKGSDLESFVTNKDIIIHCAGINRGSHEEMIESNINLTLKIGELCKNLDKKLIYVGTTYNKKDSYGFTKEIAENILDSYIRNFDCNFYVVRAPNIIGKGCRPYYNSFITTLIYEFSRGNKSIESKIINLNERVVFIPVEDLCDLLLDMVELSLPYHVFNYPYVQSLSFRDIIDLLNNPETNTSSQGLYFHTLMEYYRNYDIKK